MCSSALPSILGLFAGKLWSKTAQDEESEETWVVAMHSGIPSCDSTTMSVYPCQTSWWPIYVKMKFWFEKKTKLT